MNSMKFVISMSFLIAAVVAVSRKDKRGADFGFSSFGAGYSIAQDLPSLPVGPWVPAGPAPWASASASAPWASASSNPWAGQSVFVKTIPSIQSHLSPYQPSPSAAEIATAVAAAKEASSSVQQAQQRVQAAKEMVLSAQKLASLKETEARQALRQSEALAAAQRQSASAAASAVVLAQQRLAEAKAQVAQRQNLASHKEAHAARIIAHSANQAAKEIHRTDHLKTQQRVQAAKEMVLSAQKLASLKKTEARQALRQSEALAAAQRQSASAAASAVVLAQQRLAEAKAQVAQRQNLASHKEAHAARIIAHSANQAAKEIHRTEQTANKIAAIQRSEAQAAIQHVTATKDASLEGVAAAVSATNNLQSYIPTDIPTGPQFPGKKTPFVDYPWG